MRRALCTSTSQRSRRRHRVSSSARCRVRPRGFENRPSGRGPSSGASRRAQGVSEPCRRYRRPRPPRARVGVRSRGRARRRRRAKTVFARMGGGGGARARDASAGGGVSVHVASERHARRHARGCARGGSRGGTLRGRLIRHAVPSDAVPFARAQTRRPIGFFEVPAERRRRSGRGGQVLDKPGGFPGGEIRKSAGRGRGPVRARDDAAPESRGGVRLDGVVPTGVRRVALAMEISPSRRRAPRALRGGPGKTRKGVDVRQAETGARRKPKTVQGGSGRRRLGARKRRTREGVVTTRRRESRRYENKAIYSRFTYDTIAPLPRARVPVPGGRDGPRSPYAPSYVLGTLTARRQSFSFPPRPRRRSCRAWSRPCALGCW